MEELKAKLNKSGFYLYYLFLVIGIFVLILSDKGDFLLWLNAHHNSASDFFFKYWTHLGDGLIFAVLGILFLMISYYNTIMLLFAVISQTIIIQGLKRIVFNDVVRPRLFFEDFDAIYQVPGVEVHVSNSFPSGHTATAFTVAVILSLLIKNKYWTALLMVLAILVGLSRIYLLQHFFIDIYFGSLIGFLNALIIYSFMESSMLRNKASLKKGLIKK